MNKRLAFFIATSFYAGILPAKFLALLRPHSSNPRRGIGGGFMGSLVGLLIQLTFVFIKVPQAGIWQATLVVLSLFVGLAVIEPAERLMYELWGARRRHSGEWTTSDYNATCWDETHGQLIAGLPVFCLIPTNQFSWLLLAFVLFRIFDIGKPWPVRWAERSLHGAKGVMFDDTFAGILAAIGTLLFAVVLR
jgi:phosphatidylglycerophosphatase A